MANIPLNHYLQGFIHPRWCRISETSTVGLNCWTWEWLLEHEGTRPQHVFLLNHISLNFSKNESSTFFLKNKKTWVHQRAPKAGKTDRPGKTDREPGRFVGNFTNFGWKRLKKTCLPVVILELDLACQAISKEWGRKQHTHQETLQKKISLLSLLSWYCVFLAIGLVLQDKLQLPHGLWIQGLIPKLHTHLVTPYTLYVFGTSYLTNQPLVTKQKCIYHHSTCFASFLLSAYQINPVQNLTCFFSRLRLWHKSFGQCNLSRSPPCAAVSLAVHHTSVTDRALDQGDDQSCQKWSAPEKRTGRTLTIYNTAIPKNPDPWWS